MVPANTRDAWRDFRRRRRWHYGLLFGGVIAFPLVSALIEQFTGWESAYYVATAFWLAAVLVTEVWLSLIKCHAVAVPFFVPCGFSTSFCMIVSTATRHATPSWIPRPMPPDFSLTPTAARLSVCGEPAAFAAHALQRSQVRVGSRPALHSL